MQTNTPLKFQLHRTDGRARRATIHLPHGPVETPTFMPVGTHGTIKAISADQVSNVWWVSYPFQAVEIGYQIALGNTYHLSHFPGEDILQEMGSLHTFMRFPHNLLTDSGGFQMVSLQKLSTVTEEGVHFRHHVTGTQLLLTPEKSIEIQSCIGADIIMALDDVCSAVCPDRERLEVATARTTRWLERCIKAHKNIETQNLFGIVQGNIYEDLRLQSLRDLKALDLPGYAVGGLSGGESKEDFWKVVELCVRQPHGLPTHKPRYLMGVGYPLDIVVCVALGFDMFDCVYPTRTARFGTVLVPEGILRIKLHQFQNDPRPLEEGCPCETCTSYSRAFLRYLFGKETTCTRLLTIHNLTYMKRLCIRMQTAIEHGMFADFVREFLSKQFVSGLRGTFSKVTSNAEPVAETAPSPPLWVKEALFVAGIDISDMYHLDDKSGTEFRHRHRLDESSTKSEESSSSSTASLYKRIRTGLSLRSGTVEPAKTRSCDGS